MEWLKEAVDYGIIAFLALMSVAAVAVAIERYLVYKHIRVEDFSDKK